MNQTTNRLASRRNAVRRNQRGNALVFTLLALVIGAIVVAVGVEQYTESERSASIGSVVTEVAAIIGNAKANDGQLGYTGLTTAIAVGGGTIPRNRANPGNTTASNKFSGAITLVDNNASVVGTANLSYANVTSDQCKEIVMGTQSLARQIQVNGTDVKPLDGAVVPATLANQCLVAANVAISWIIGRS
jgi:hypothetical protein